MKFEFMTANRIVAERGAFKKIGAIAKSFGSKAFVASGMFEENDKAIMSLLEAEGLQHVLIKVVGEPTIEGVSEALALARKEKCDVFIGFGGGSAMDTAKAVSVMMNNEGEFLDYLEVIGKGQTLKNRALPCIAIPTTSGTGAEVTKNAVLGVKDSQLKVSLRSENMLARVVLLDPELTVSVPPAVTASTGLDALTQVIEPFVSNQANPITDAFCREGMTRAARSLKVAFDQGSNLDAREDMALTSLFGGLALANAKLGTVHGFAAVIGGMFPIPHGTVCGILLPYTMESNVKALLEREPDSMYLKRYDEVAQILTGNPKANAADGVKWIQELCAHLNLPTLSKFNISEADFDVIIENTMQASSTKGNPIKLTEAELRNILSLAL